MDILSDIFTTIHLQGTLYFRTEFTPPWATAVPAYSRAARFHLVVEGECFIRIEDGETFHLKPGHVLLITNGRAHVMADSLDRDAPPLESVLEEAGYSGEGVLVLGNSQDGATTRLVCGHLDFREGSDHPLLRALPDHILITPEIRAREPLLDATLRLLVEHVFARNAGSMAAVMRLSEVVFIEAVRVAAESSVDVAAMLTAFADPQIGRALSLIHRYPTRPWTVESLATEVGMSRTRFAARFQETMGSGPIGYLTEWRLQKALAMLTTTTHSVREIARQAGYLSAAAFTRAFGARFGKPPSAWRAGPNGDYDEEELVVQDAR